MDYTSTTDGCDETQHSEVSNTADSHTRIPDTTPLLGFNDSENGSEITAEPEDIGFDYLYFGKFLAYRNINLVNFMALSRHQTTSLDSDKAKTLGEGKTMSVELRNLDGEVVAIKTPRKLIKMVADSVGGDTSTTAVQSVHSNFMIDMFFELQVMSHKPLCDHPNIVKLIGLTFYRPAYHGIVIPIPIVESADLRYPDLQRFMESTDRETPLPLNSAYELISDIADGVTVLHDFGVIHGDIKPQNVLIFTDNNSGRAVAKLGDFGSSGIKISHDNPRGWTEKWLPPDYTRNSPEIGEPSLDIYAFGRVGIHICTEGMLPVDARAIDINATSTAIQSVKRDIADPSSLGVLLEILGEALQLDRTSRSTDISTTRARLFGPYNPRRRC